MLPLDQSYPHIAGWVLAYGWIEIGEGYRGRFSARALDEGGMVWEGGFAARTLDEAMQALEAGLAEWMRAQFPRE